MDPQSKFVMLMASLPLLLGLGWLSVLACRRILGA